MRRNGCIVERIEVRAPRVEVVDPTGAGDVFGAACALAWAWGRPLREVLWFAARAGATACTTSGPPSPQALRRLLDSSSGVGG